MNNPTYDLCIDYDTLLKLGENLKQIAQNLDNSTRQMATTIQNSRNFLAGNQFEKARQITFNCLRISKKTIKNIEFAIEYLEQLKASLEDYAQCAYYGNEYE